MLLYVTDFSPFARMARVVRRDQQLEERVEEIMAVTRTPNSPYYKINPSGRVPYLVCDDGVGIEGSQPVCYFLDHLDSAPVLDAPEDDVGIAHRDPRRARRQGRQRASPRARADRAAREAPAHHPRRAHRATAPQLFNGD